MPGVEWPAAAAAAVGEHNNECLHRDCFHVKEYGGGGGAAAAMQQVWESGGGGGERGKVCILSIDGGGGMLRGIIPARVLAYLEELLKRKSGNSEARIADYFDVVAGTSVGGILATMLCACDANNRPLFTAEETWKLIAEKGRSVFFNQLLPTSRMWSRLRGLMRPRFSSKRLEALLKQYLIRDGRPLTLRDTMKPVLIPCYDLATAGPFLFSRADALENQTWNFNLWEVCRATTAVPSLFKPAYMTSVDGNTSCTAVDGGVVMHNPTAAAVTHVLHNKLEFPRVQGVNDLLVLSLGTGQMDQPYAYNTVRGWGAFQWVKPIANIVLDSISDMVDHTISMSFGDFRQQYLRIQMSGLHSRSSAEMDAGSHTPTKRLMQLADEVLDHKSMEHLPFGGRMPLIASNRERLDWFADQLVLEHKSRIVVSALFMELCVHIRFEGNVAEVLAVMGLILEHVHFDSVQDGVSSKPARGAFFKLSTTSTIEQHQDMGDMLVRKCIAKQMLRLHPQDGGVFTAAK